MSDITVYFDLDNEVTVSNLAMSEQRKRIDSFRLECKKDDEWVTILNGGKIAHGISGGFMKFTFDTLSGRQFRLVIDKAYAGPKHGPALYEVELW